MLSSWRVGMVVLLTSARSFLVQAQQTGKETRERDRERGENVCVRES